MADNSKFSNLKQKFPGVFVAKDKDKSLLTENYAPGYRVYTEDLINQKGKEYRTWDKYKSKLAAAIHLGLKNLPIKPGSIVLYLGASTGTTASHVSDIVGKDGLVICVEFAKRPMRQLLSVCEIRDNMVPFLADARRPEDYENIGEVDVIYQDVAQPDQAAIMMRNASFFLRKGSYAMLCVKSQSINASANKQDVYRGVKSLLREYFTIEFETELDPYDKDHMFLVLRKK